MILSTEENIIRKNQRKNLKNINIGRILIPDQEVLVHLIVIDHKAVDIHQIIVHLQQNIGIKLINVLWK